MKSRKSKKILDILLSEPEKDLELQDVPYYDIIHPIYTYYLLGDFKNMVNAIRGFELGELEFFRLIVIYLKKRYRSEVLIKMSYEHIKSLFFKPGYCT